MNDNQKINIQRMLDNVKSLVSGIESILEKSENQSHKNKLKKDDEEAVRRKFREQFNKNLKKSSLHEESLNTIKTQKHGNIES